MKREILRKFREAGKEYISGQSLCESLAVSRQAVWKNMEQLRDAGYEIESVTGKGYRLVGTPERLYGPDIESRLGHGCLCQRVECHTRLDSTNIRAKQLAETGESEGTLVLADEQSAGKGRRGRRWDSRDGIGIWMSLILRPQIEPLQAAGITLVSAMAVAEAMGRVCQVSPQIKWPNDIVLNGKKVCGILTEMSSERDYIHYVVTGIGINVNTEQFEAGLEARATSVYLESGKRVDRMELIAAVMDAFTVYYDKYLQTGDMSLLQSGYDRMLANRGREVQIFYGVEEEADPSEVETGTAKGIDRSGALLVETAQGVKTVVSGEVSVRGMYGYV